MGEISKALAVAAVLGMAAPSHLSAAQMSVQAMQNDAQTALSSLYAAAGIAPHSASCASHYFDWEPAGFLFQCATGDVTAHYWLATAVKGETLGLTPLSAPAKAIAPEVGTTISPRAYPAQAIVNIPAKDLHAAYTQAQQVFDLNTHIEN